MTYEEQAEERTDKEIAERLANIAWNRSEIAVKDGFGYTEAFYKEMSDPL